MTTLTFPHIDYAQRAQLIEYIKSNNLKFEISEPEEKHPTSTFINSMEEMKTGATFRLQNTENPLEEILQ